MPPQSGHSLVPGMILVATVATLAPAVALTSRGSTPIVSGPSMPHECFADEIAIDFPSVGRVVERMRDAFLGERTERRRPAARRSVAVAARSVRRPRRVARRAGARHVSALRRPRRNVDRAVRPLPRHRASRASSIPVRVTVPAGVADGARFRFRLTSPDCVVRARRSPRRDPLVGGLIRSIRIRQFRNLDLIHLRSRCRTSTSLGVLFIVWGLLTTLVGVSTLALGVGAVALITSASRSGGGQVRRRADGRGRSPRSRSSPSSGAPRTSSSACRCGASGRGRA